MLRPFSFGEPQSVDEQMIYWRSRVEQIELVCSFRAVQYYKRETFRVVNLKREMFRVCNIGKITTA